MPTSTEYKAVYYYPGVFTAEVVTRTIEGPTLEDAIAGQPQELTGYFVKDGWYAVVVHKVVERLFKDVDRDEARWLVESNERVFSAIVGERVHYEDDSVAGEEFEILRSNIRANSKDGFGVKTRSGNWQFASDWDYVISPEQATS